MKNEELIKRPTVINVFAGVFLILFVFSLPFTLGALVANAPRGNLIDIAEDIFFRIFYIGLPVGLWYSGRGLLRLKNRGRISAIITLMIMSLMSFVLGVHALVNKGGIIRYTLEQRISSSIPSFIFALCCVVSVGYFTRSGIKGKFK